MTRMLRPGPAAGGVLPCFPSESRSRHRVEPAGTQRVAAEKAAQGEARCRGGRRGGEALPRHSGCRTARSGRSRRGGGRGSPGRPQPAARSSRAPAPGRGSADETSEAAPPLIIHLALTSFQDGRLGDEHEVEPESPALPAGSSPAGAASPGCARRRRPAGGWRPGPGAPGRASARSRPEGEERAVDAPPALQHPAEVAAPKKARRRDRNLAAAARSPSGPPALRR